MSQKLICFTLACLILGLGSADAQQPKKIPRIGFIAMSTSASGGQNFEAFRQGLRDFGYIEGHNILLEHRWADGWSERLPLLLTN